MSKLKCQNYSLKLKSFTILALVLSFAFLVLRLTEALAQSPTPSPTRIEEIKERVQERIEGVKEKAAKRAFWGTLTEISNSTLVLNSSRGERRVKTDDETEFLSGKKEIGLADLEIGGFIIVIGSLDENGVLTAKRIISLSQAPKPAVKRHAVYGKVSDIVPDEKVISLTHPLKKDVVFEVKVSNSTIITKKVDGKIKKVLFSAIEVDDRIVAVGTKEGDNGTITAKLIHVIPGEATGLEKVTPTPTPTPTPKTPTPTPTE